MVAAGLTPGVEVRQDVFRLCFRLKAKSSSFQISREQHFAVILIEFALNLMVLLEQINKDSFQVIK